MLRTSESNLRPEHSAKIISWFRALSLEARRSYLVALCAKPRTVSNRRLSRREMIQLMWIILLALVSGVIGIYGGVVSSHHDRSESD